MPADPTMPGKTSGPILPGRRSLKKNILYAVGGMGVFQACQFGVIVLLAKFAPSSVLGQVRLSLAVATPIVMFCSLELRGALVADAANEFRFGTYRRLRELMMTLAGTVLAAVALGVAFTERRWAYAVIFAGMCASKIVLSLAEIGWGLFQKRERLDLMAASAVWRGVAMLAAFGLLVPLGAYLSARGVWTPDGAANGAALAVTLYVLASIGLLVGFDHPRVAADGDHDPTWSWVEVVRLARRTFPLGLVLLVLHLCNSIPELVLARQPEGRAALGHFGALVMLTLAGNLAVFQAANAAANRLSTYYQTNLRAFLALAGKLFLLAGGVGAVTLAVAFGCGEWLLHVLYRADYARYADEFRLIAVAATVTLFTNVFGVMTTQMRLFWLQVPAQVLVLGATATAAVVLIPGADNLVRAGAWTIFTRALVHAALYAGCVLFGVACRRRVLATRVSLKPESGPAGGVGAEW